MQDLSLHVLDIVENAINAGATKVVIFVKEDIEKDRLIITIADNGKGMTKEQVSKLTDPFYTTRTCRKVGLGLPLLKIMARQCHGDVIVKSKLGRGTCVRVIFQYGNIDRPPLGDIALTVACIICANPHLKVIYRHKVGDIFYKLTRKKIEKMLKNKQSKKNTFALILEDARKGLFNLARERKEIFVKRFGYTPRVELI